MDPRSILLLVAVMAAMYFLTIRPQKKKMDAEKKMRDAIKVGDKVVTIGGVRGVITAINDDSFEIETGSEHQKIEFLKQALSYVVKPVEGYNENNNQIVYEPESDVEHESEVSDEE